MNTPTDTTDCLPPEILNAAEVAEVLRIHKRTVARLAREGQISGKKLGAKWQFTRTDLEKYMSAGSSIRDAKTEKANEGVPANAN